MLKEEAVKVIFDRTNILKEMGVKIKRQDELTCQIELIDSSVITIFMTTGTWVAPDGSYHNHDWDGLIEYIMLRI